MSPDWTGAANGTTDEIETFSSLTTPFTFTVNAGTLADAKSIGTDEYPTYGKFVQGTQDGTTVYVEAPLALRQFFDLNDVEPGTTVRIVEVWKENGRWTLTATTQ